MGLGFLFMLGIDGMSFPFSLKTLQVVCEVGGYLGANNE
jgi:hypothetical protein